MLFSKKPLLIFASALALSGCLGNDQPNTASPANPDNNVTVITLKNNPYLKATNHIQQIQSNRLSTASLASSEEITNPNSTVVDHPKIHRSDEEVYMGIPIMNNTGSPISGFYIHNWDRTAGNYINGYNMMWESGVEIAHTMQNNKYHDWYFPVGTTEANVNSSSLMWDAYGYLGGHWSATDSAYGFNLMDTRITDSRQMLLYTF